MSPGLDGPGAAGMPPDAQAKASQMAGLAGPVKSAGVKSVGVLPEPLAGARSAEEVAAPSEGAASPPPPAPGVPMLCSIFSSQVWRAAGAEAERRRAERAVKARRARAAKSQVTPKGQRERGLALFAQAEKRRAEEAEAEAEEAARASRAAAARQAEPSQSKASSLARAEAQAPPGKEEGLGRGGETPAAAQKAAVAGP